MPEHPLCTAAVCNNCRVRFFFFSPLFTRLPSTLLSVCRRIAGGVEGAGPRGQLSASARL